MANDELMEHIAAMAKRWIVEQPADPVQEYTRTRRDDGDMLEDLE